MTTQLNVMKQWLSGQTRRTHERHDRHGPGQQLTLFDEPNHLTECQMLDHFAALVAAEAAKAEDKPAQI